MNLFIRLLGLLLCGLLCESVKTLGKVRRMIRYVLHRHALTSRRTRICRGEQERSERQEVEQQKSPKKRKLTHVTSNATQSRL